MYAGVPTTAPVRVSVIASGVGAGAAIAASLSGGGSASSSAERSRARPKSVTRTTPSAPTQDVRRLEVAMHRPARCAARGRDAACMYTSTISRQPCGPARCHAARSSPSTSSMHDAGVLADPDDLVHGDDVGCDSRAIACASRTQPRSAPLRAPVREELDGDVPIELGIVRSDDDAHAARAERATNDVAADVPAAVDAGRQRPVADRHRRIERVALRAVARRGGAVTWILGLCHADLIV